MVCHNKGKTDCVSVFGPKGATTLLGVIAQRTGKNLKSYNLYTKKICLHLRDVEGGKSKLKSVLRRRHLLLAVSLSVECIAMLERVAGWRCSQYSRPARGRRAVGILHKNTNWWRKQLARGVLQECGEKTDEHKHDGCLG